VAGISIVMLHPLGRTSDVQRRQMTCVDEPNIHNIAIDGDFDAAQRIVKAILKDPTPGARLSAINSINWARLAAQASYYLFAASRLPASGAPLSFAVPTGNFGDVFAGYAAARMGLGVGRLMVATNANDILNRALGAGDYSRTALQPTQSPSMDIQVSSNFERLLFDLMDRDAGRLAAAMSEFDASGRLALDAALTRKARRWFDSAAVSEAETAATMRWAWDAHGRLICPHTAVGVAAARRLRADAPGALVVLETAHPAKFPGAVRAATGRTPEPPARLAAMLEGEERFATLPADEPAIRRAVETVALEG
jgi:threonine synthase